MNILIIEPDAILAEIYCEAINALGAEVRTASTAQAAIHACDTMAPDLVILELQLPRHNGVEFLYEFRSYIEWQQVPVLVHSAVPAEDIGLPALYGPLSITGYLYKPKTTLARLLSSVQRAMPATV